MAEEQPAPASLLAFPSPPLFWQSFTPENLERISSFRAAQPQAAFTSKSTDPATALTIRVLDLPPELRYLQPPEPPQDGIYRCFGEVLRLEDPIISLEDQGFKQLYTPPRTPTDGDIHSRKHTDREFILKRLAKSIMLNFLELLGVLSVNPEQYEGKVADLKTLFMNFHHLLNEYRPHQARESLILLMQDQLDRSRAETQGIRDMKEKVEGILEGLCQAKLIEENGEVVSEVKTEEGAEVWEALEKEFGSW